MQKNTESYLDDFLHLKLDDMDLVEIMKSEGLERFLRDSENIGNAVSELIEKYIDLGFEGVPDNLRSEMKETCRTLLYYGLFTHCMFYTSEHRLKHKFNHDTFFTTWSVKSITATINSYSKANHGYPDAIFDSYYNSSAESLLKRMGLGWWRRMRGRAKIHFFYTSGVNLGMLYDMEMNNLSKQ